MTGPERADQHADAEPSGLPGLPTWQGVYVVVFGWFVLVVVLLAAFSWLFS